jgi:methionine synthase I (cobalamin-dependent)
VDNVTEVLNMMEGDKWKLTCALGIPKSQLEEILTDAERIHASAKYYVKYHPNASWQLLTGELYYKKEFSAAMKSKSYMSTGNSIFTMYHD